MASYYFGKTFRLTSQYGMRKHPISGKTKMHNGADFAAPKGTPILAIGPGKVILNQWVSGYGYMIAIRHPDGTVSRYAHMASKSPLKVGATVRAGQQIGRVGATGNATGPHLHLEIMRGKTFLDPVKFLRGLTGGSTPRTLHLKSGLAGSSSSSSKKKSSKSSSKKKTTTKRTVHLKPGLK